jgi:hypothetical protein
VRLRPAVAAALAAHGVAVSEADTPELLRDRLNDAYLVQVRDIRERQRAGHIPLRGYAQAVQELRDRFALLGVPLEAWTEPPAD